MTIYATGDEILVWDDNVLKYGIVNYEHGGSLDIDIDQHQAITVDAEDVVVVLALLASVSP